MGMQCHFQRADVPDGTQISRAGEHGDWYVDYDGQRLHANSDKGDHFWFDCGFRSEHAMRQIHMLIGWRVCFTCS